MADFDRFNSLGSIHNTRRCYCRHLERSLGGFASRNYKCIAETAFDHIDLAGKYLDSWIIHLCDQRNDDPASVLGSKRLQRFKFLDRGIIQHRLVDNQLSARYHIKKK
jgi:hypothetical protein